MTFGGYETNKKKAGSKAPPSKTEDGYPTPCEGLCPAHPSKTRSLAYWSACLGTAESAIGSRCSVIKSSTMSDAASPLKFDTLNHWLQKGLAVHRLKGRDGEAADSPQKALESLGVGFAVAAAIEFLVVFMFQKDLKAENLFGIPLFAVPLAFSFLSFLLFLLVCLRAAGVRLRAGVTFSLTCYVFSGAIPLLMLFSYDQLSEALRLFITRRDPSLPYLSSATVILLFSEQASRFSIIRAWILFVLEVATFGWYFLWNFSRVLFESAYSPQRKLRVPLALILAITLNAFFFRIFAARLYWSILGRLIS